MAVVNNVELALAEGVPELDGLVPGGRDDLPVVGGERDREDITGVADEFPCGQAGVEVPESEGLVPRRRKGELAVGGDDDVRDEVVVTVQDLLGEADVVVTGELPDDAGLVCRVSVLNCVVVVSTGDAPREEVKIMSGFSEVVAMAVTQLEWPLRDPL